MLIFYFLGVGPPCCSILCQFWLCEEAQCVYLRRHLGSPPICSIVKAFILLFGYVPTVFHPVVSVGTWTVISLVGQFSKVLAWSLGSG